MLCTCIYVVFEMCKYLKDRLHRKKIGNTILTITINMNFTTILLVFCKIVKILFCTDHVYHL